jgi:hypothetical protein
MRTVPSVAAVAVLIAAPALAQPEPAAGTQSLCAGFDETHEGVWLDRSGAEVLRFRFAMNDDGTACYAWLNAVPQWDIARAGSNVGEGARREGSLRAWGDPGPSSRGVSVDVETGEALYSAGRGVTRGRLLGR